MYSACAPLQVVAAKREVIIEKINEVEEAWKERSWLVEYDKDTNRYKVGLHTGLLLGSNQGKQTFQDR